jgi:hypothetical protein
MLLIPLVQMKATETYQLYHFTLPRQTMLHASTEILRVSSFCCLFWLSDVGTVATETYLTNWLPSLCMVAIHAIVYFLQCRRLGISIVLLPLHLSGRKSLVLLLILLLLDLRRILSY